jgi:hypothetical protein
MKEYLLAQFRACLQKAAEQFDQHALDNCVCQNITRDWCWDENEFDDVVGQISGGLLAYLESIYGDMYDCEVEADRHGADYTIYIRWSRREPLDNPFTDCINAVLPDFE